jgi:hypothetical protein
MVKKLTSIRLDPEDLIFAQEWGINISKIAQEILKVEIKAYCDSFDSETDDLISQSKSRAHQKQIVSDYLKKRTQEKSQELREMRAHIKAAKEAGKERGEAETDFGHVFPDAIWEER